MQYHVKYSNFRFLDRPRPQLAPNITMLFDEVIAGIRLETNRQKEFLEKYKDGIKKSWRKQMSVLPYYLIPI
ncbi:hypothetical protein K6959_13185 [Bacillus aquiflavi]|uniref:hypothetical protein n=1 Tax=Bacillus aquiflavi TaxID=2672567 RepID=UPI001CA948F2|nr:hypothetical protein [Bacillus aquiflavi]UAC47608.1 hypothetical protein K6959_13185 [Bacillus aquiflavi]